MSLEHQLYIKKLKRTDIIVRIFQIGILILFLILWELMARLNIIDPFLSSSPSRIFKTIAQLYKDEMLFVHLKATLWETIVSFLLATFLGAIVAILLWANSLARRITEPYLIVLNALPKVALGPLIIIWVGAGKGAIITMALLIMLIITIISMLHGFMSVDKEKIQLLQSMNASKWQILTKLVIPFNIPNFLSILKINVGLSWVGTIMGEYLVSKEGIGYLIVYGSQVFKLDLVMASTILLCFLATIMYFAVDLFEKFIKKLYR